MPSTPGRREVGFVLAVATAGLVAVLVVAFAPWYPGPAPEADAVPAVTERIVRVIKGADGSVSLTP